MELDIEPRDQLNAFTQATLARRGGVRRVLLLLVTAVLGVRLFAFIHRYAVNVLFFDQWDFWAGMMRGDGLWTLFTTQLGPCREGVGFLVTRLSALASGWDSKVEAYVVGGLFVVGCGLAFAIKWRLTRRWSMFDVCIPLVLFTVGNLEAYVGTVNPAHGPVPMLLLLALVYARLRPRDAVRAAATLILHFALVFTGFGVCFAPIGVGLLALDLAAAIRERTKVVAPALAFLGSIATLALFARHYVFQPAVPCFVFPDPHPLVYLSFVARLWLRSLQLDDLRRAALLLAGVPLFCASLWLLLYGALGTLRSWGESRRHETVFTLCAFSWAFAVATAVGRACLGSAASHSSRYVSYTLLQLFAAYVAVQTSALKEPFKRSLLSFCLLLFVVKEVRTDHTLGEAIWYADGKQHWRDCYRETEDAALCNRRTGFVVYPDGTGRTIEPQLRYLEQHHLNLFKE
ncbi:MAG TPA: hypothetical protein VGH20_04410 [Myxococcales bacterium]